MKKFSKSISFEAKEMTLTSADERFLQKAMDLVKKNLSNADLNIEEMGSELGMSRAQLYRKIDAVSGQSVHEFIRIVRLKKAAELLTNSDFQISEIVERVGFNSFAYFTKSFKDYFGVTPSAYKR